MTKQEKIQMDAKRTRARAIIRYNLRNHSRLVTHKAIKWPAPSKWRAA